MFPLKDFLPHARVPLITLLIIALNVFVYVAGFSREPLVAGGASTLSASSHDVWVYEWGTIPCELLARCENQPGLIPVEEDVPLLPGLTPRSGTVQVEVPERSPWATLVASAFLHGSLLHLAGNMLFLWVFGGNVEDAMSRFTFLGFYISAAVVSALAQSVIQPGSAIPQIGASGAIAAVIGAYLLLYPRARVLSVVAIFPIVLPAWIVAGFWGVQQFVATWQTLFVPGGAGHNGIAYMAHLAGFAFGLAMIRSIASSNPIYHQLYGGGDEHRDRFRPL